MNEPQYRCRNERRREVVRAAGTLNGIDFVEVSADQFHLDVHFLQDLPGSGPDAVPPAGPPLDVANVVIVGGVRVPNVSVISLTAAGTVLTVDVDRAGDFSPYELQLVDPAADNAVPDGFDTQLSHVTFSFKAGCPNPLDCETKDACPPALLSEPALDYLAKDYNSLRGLMFDRLATTLPDVTERNPADVVTMLVELLAYVGDRLSYYQDAVATEAYLGTARSRVSVRRHARLLDYFMHDGCSARTFLHFEVDTGLALDRGTAVTAAAPDVTNPEPIVFETAHDLIARKGGNEIAIHTWSDEQCCLPAGATRATLVGGPDVVLAGGDFMLFEETVDPATGGDPDPTHRQVVRLVAVTPDTDRLDDTPVLEVEWARSDALTFPLCISVEGAVTAVARGNVALADHGETRHAAGLPVETPIPPGKWRPLVPETPIAFVAPYDATAATLPAASLLALDPRSAHAAVTLSAGDELWQPAFDLLDAGPTAPVFVVEVEEDGTTRLRFGDGVSGQLPPADQSFSVTYRVGGGPLGNVVAEVLDKMVVAVSGVTAVRNPLPAVGGTPPEPMELARQLAPQAFRRQERTVTAADYAAVAGRFAEVQDAVGVFRWTGSWHTAFVTVDRLGGGAPDDDDLGAQIRDFLDTYRMAGVDVEIDAPVPVPIVLALSICVAAGFFSAEVQADVLDALSSQVLPDGRKGFFHPDNFTFGQPVYLSQIYGAVLAVPGVQRVSATVFQRYGRPANNELVNGVLPVLGREIALLDTVANSLERGQLILTMAGGL